jgi:hypothetical protein
VIEKVTKACLIWLCADIDESTSSPSMVLHDEGYSKRNVGLLGVGRSLEGVRTLTRHIDPGKWEKR